MKSAPGPKPTGFFIGKNETEGSPRRLPALGTLASRKEQRRRAKPGGAAFSAQFVSYASFTDFMNPLATSSTQPASRQTQAATET